MAVALIDTSIVVDFLRGYPAAQAWFLTQNDLGVSRAVYLEIIEGAENRRDQATALKLLRRFELIELTTPDVVWATTQLITFNLSHNIDAFDCLIASVNYRLQLPLYTRNLKHFVPVLGNLVRRPY